jgi:hypothetical protein
VNGTRLTLGLVGALAAAGALSRRGGANVSPSIKGWFGNSVITNADGTPRLVYHQTRPQAQSKIRRQGFSLSHARNRSSDREMPDGVFVKFNDAPLGVGGVQIPLYVRAENPLRVKDREALLAWLFRNSPEYVQLRQEAEQVDREYDSTFQAIFHQKTPQGVERGTQAWKDIREDRSRRMTAVLDAWNPASDEYSARLRALTLRALRAAGHDSLWMERDEGTKGRVVETLVLLDPEQVRVWRPYMG